MDIALAVEKIVPRAQYKNAKTYATLVDTWADDRPVPSYDALYGAWLIVQQDQAAKIIQQAQEAQQIAAIVVELQAFTAANISGMTADEAVKSLAALVEKITVLLEVMIPPEYIAEAQAAAAGL